MKKFILALLVMSLGSALMAQPQTPPPAAGGDKPAMGDTKPMDKPAKKEKKMKKGKKKKGDKPADATTGAPAK